VYSQGVLRGYCNATPTAGRVRDLRADNIGVYGRFRLSNGTIVDVSDANGSAAGDGQITALIRAIECVSRDGGSSGWKQVV
jgi:hypothetical protein